MFLTMGVLYAPRFQDNAIASPANQNSSNCAANNVIVPT